MVNFKIVILSATTVGLFCVLDLERNSDRRLRVEILLLMILIELGNALSEGLLDVLSILGTDLEVSQPIFLLEKLFCFFIGNFSVFQVTLVSQDHKVKVVLGSQIGLGEKLIPPLDDFFEGFSVSQIEHQETAVTSLVKDVQKSSEFLLASSVPNRVRELNILDDHFMGKLVCSDCYPVLALKLLINVSIDNRGFSHPFKLTQILR
jgi:hypothetical protein